MEEEMILIQVVIRVIFGAVCALIASNRGRSAVAWFLIGALIACLGLIILLVIPDLKLQEERERLIALEHRRLREQIRKNRMVSDQRHAEVGRRLGAHDRVLQLDTGEEAGDDLPVSLPPPLPANRPPDHRRSQWRYADGDRSSEPVDFARLQDLWRTAALTPDSLVWTEGLPEWWAIREVPGLEEALNA